MLSDVNTYSVIHKDPLKKLTTDIRSLLVRWKREEYINSVTYRRMLITDGILPRAYGLTKIHKVNYSLRLIVSCLNTPLYLLASHLHNIIYNSIPKHFSHINNSFHLVNELNGKLIDSDTVLLSLDVMSLFTKVSTDLIGNSIVKRWDHISCNTALPLNEFLTAISLIINSTFFTFSN